MAPTDAALAAFRARAASVGRASSKPPKNWLRSEALRGLRTKNRAAGYLGSSPTIASIVSLKTPTAVRPRRFNSSVQR